MSGGSSLPEPLAERLILAEFARIQAEELQYSACMLIVAYLVRDLYPAATTLIVRDLLHDYGLQLGQIRDCVPKILWDVRQGNLAAELHDSDSGCSWSEVVSDIEIQLCHALGGSAPDRRWCKCAGGNGEFIVILPAGDVVAAALSRTLDA